MQVTVAGQQTLPDGVFCGAFKGRCFLELFRVLDQYILHIFRIIQLIDVTWPNFEVNNITVLPLIIH